MKFEIGFNRLDENDVNSFYEFIGAKLAKDENCSYYEIDIATFEDLEVLMNKINLKYKGNTYSYSPVISFDNLCILLDDKV
jgi:hypothetical protein